MYHDILTRALIGKPDFKWFHVGHSMLKPAIVSILLWAGTNASADDIAPDIATLPSPEAYVRVQDGQYYVNGHRLKLWGSQSSPLGDSHEAIDREVDHFRRLGFNLYRSISVGSTYDMTSSTPGDGSRMDLQDYTFAAIARSGGYNWLDLLNNVSITAADVDVIDDPLVSREEWIAAMDGKTVRPSAVQLIWDRRTQEIFFQHIDRVMNHVNPYTGLRYADDPSIALIELVNEQWWTPEMLAGGQLATLSPAMIRPLLIQWNDWLKEKYGNTEDLRKAWNGLYPEESLESSTVLLQPLIGRKAMPEMAAVLGIDIDLGRYQDGDETISNAHRGEDVLQFFMDAHVAFKLDAMKRLRSHGRPDRGASVVPVLLTTGTSYSPQSAYEHTFGSGFAFASYPSMIDDDVDSPTYPWLMPLSLPPTLGDWMTQNRLEGIPGIIYETMTFQPGKYRADYPLRIAAFSAIANLDVVSWHFYGSHTYGETARPLQMPYEEHYWQAVVFGDDEVVLASMKLASTIFLHGNLQPPQKPTILVVGRDVLYNPEAIRWGRLSPLLGPTAMQFGLRIRFDPSVERSHFIGPHTEKYADIVRPTPDIAYYWKRGIMVIDSPRVQVLAGFVPQSYRFSSGDRLEDVSVHNQDGTPYIDPDERYVCFAFCSQDGKDLAESNDVVGMAVSTSWNTGFSFDVDKYEREVAATHRHGPKAAARSIENGTLPVLVSRVGWTYRAPWLNGMKAEFVDFSLNPYREEILTEGAISVTPVESLFFVRLTRD